MKKPHSIALALCAVLATPCHAGDTFDATLALLAPEVMVPTVFEIADYGPLFMTPEEWALRGFDDRDLAEFVAPPQVPAPAALVAMLTALALLAAVRGRRV